MTECYIYSGDSGHNHMLVLHDTAVAADGGKYHNKTTEGRAPSGIQEVEGTDCVGASTDVCIALIEEGKGFSSGFNPA